MAVTVPSYGSLAGTSCNKEVPSSNGPSSDPLEKTIKQGSCSENPHSNLSVNHSHTEAESNSLALTEQSNKANTSSINSTDGTFYTAWFCPFAQRAAIAINQKEISVNSQEITLYLPDGTRNPSKPVPFMTCNPLGLVPAFTDPLIQEYMDKGLPGVYESLVLIEYLDEKYSTGKKIMPSDPYLAAQVRIWTAWIGEKFAPHTNKILRSRNVNVQKMSFNCLLCSVHCLDKYLNKLSPQGGSFLGSRDTLTLFDMALFPFAWRARILLNKFRNFQFPTGPGYDRFNDWYDTVFNNASVQATLPKGGDEALCGVYSKYVDIEP